MHIGTFDKVAEEDSRKGFFGKRNLDMLGSRTPNSGRKPRSGPAPLWESFMEASLRPEFGIFLPSMSRFHLRSDKNLLRRYKRFPMQDRLENLRGGMARLRLNVASLSEAHVGAVQHLERLQQGSQS
jgi:hypothetical protein